jgi:hypothetical protein
MSNDNPQFAINYISLIDITMKNFNGKSESILPFFIEMNIQEDIYMPCQFGNITLLDNVAFYEKFPIIGEEVITIVYKDYVHEPVIKEFFIYSVLSRENVNDRGQMYTLEFCSEELLANKSQRISKSYINKECHKIAGDAFSYLSSKKPFNCVQTIGMQDYVAPTLHPFDIIQQMAARSITVNNEYGSVLFFENKDGFNFQSIETLIKGESIDYYIGDGKTAGIDKKFYIFNNFKFVQPVNNINNSIMGSHGTKTKTIDLFKRKMIDNSYNNFDDGQYSEIERVNSRNPELRLQSSNYPYKSNDGQYKITIDHLPDSGKTTKNKTLAKRYNIISSYKNGPKIHAELPFNTDITIGKMINVNIISMNVKDVNNSPTSEQDKFMTGKYIITACRHHIKPNNSITVVELSKDSYTQTYNEAQQ